MCLAKKSRNLSHSRDQDSFDLHIEPVLACSSYHGDANKLLSNMDLKLSNSTRINIRYWEIYERRGAMALMHTCSEIGKYELGIG